VADDRYLRHALVEGLDQERLARTRIAVVGAGAVGNEVVKNLALLGVGAIDLLDFDTVEIHNLTRSIFLRESDVGTPKADVVAARAADVDPHVRITPMAGDAWRTLTLAHLARCDALIAAVDNFEARLRLSQLALLAGTDFVNAGIDARHAVVERFPFAAAALPACYECHLPASAYARVAARYSCGGLRRALHAERKVPTTAITASIAGALAVQAALAIGEAEQAHARRVFLDTRSGLSTVSVLERQAQCVGCGGFAARPRVVPGAGGWLRALQSAAPDATAVRLSDALVFGYACTVCGVSADGVRYVGQRADALDDRIMQCARCGELAVDVDIRTETTVQDLAALFGAQALPAKFLLADDVCIDLEAS
jgi:molybdopterin/thiamine biosynthesis adenylyltransferase